MSRDENSRTSLQMYWDSSERTINALNTVNRVDTFDIDFQHSFNLTEQQHVTWSMGYRRNNHDNTGSAALMYYPDKRTDDIYSLFVQDEITASAGTMETDLWAARYSIIQVPAMKPNPTHDCYGRLTTNTRSGHRYRVRCVSPPGWSRMYAIAKELFRLSPAATIPLCLF